MHPDGKKGTNISRAKYETVKNFLLQHIKKEGEITYEKLTDLAIEHLQPTFDGKVVWYIVSVKLDLEARGIIERVPKLSPHELRMKT